MVRLTFFLATAALALVSSTAFVLPQSAHQTVPDDVIGRFELLSAVSNDACPNVIEHEQTIAEGENSIPHSTMKMNDRPCEDGGALEILTDSGAASAAVEGAPKDLVNSVGQTDQDVIYAIERSGRDCGSRNKDKLRASTLIVLIKPSEDVTIATIEAKASQRLMIVRSFSTLCVYIAELRPQDSPSPMPSPSSGPSATTAAPSTTVGAVGGTTSIGAATSPTVVSPAPTAVVDTPTDSDNLDATNEEDEGLSNADPSDVGVDSASASPDGGDDNVCFPADATVELEHGATKHMHQVRIGDRVKVADGVFSDVFMFTHKEAHGTYEFVTLETRSGHSVSATSGHYVYINDALAAAGTAKVGDRLTLDTGDTTLVVRVMTEMKQGLYNPQTLHGDIAVNSIRATTFTRSVDMGSAQALLMPLRMMYSTFGWTTSMLDNGADTLANLMPNGEAVL